MTNDIAELIGRFARPKFQTAHSDADTPGDDSDPIQTLIAHAFHISRYPGLYRLFLLSLEQLSFTFRLEPAGGRDYVDLLMGGPGVAFDCRYQLALYVARVTQNKRIPYDLSVRQAALARESGDMETLRLIIACVQMVQLRPVFNDVFHHRTAAHFLQQDQIPVLQSWFASGFRPVQNKNDGDRILLCLSWVPAAPETGAHLRQLTNYSKALLSVKATPVHIKILLTHECATRYCLHNIQYSSVTSIRIINENFLERLGPDQASRITIACVVPDGTQSYYDNISREIVEFDPTAILRWYGFFQSFIPAQAIWQHYPVIGLQFNASNAIDAYSHICLSQGDKPIVSVDDPRWRPHAIPVEVIERHRSLPRDAVRNGHEGLLVVTALAGGRLENTIAGYSDEWIGLIVDLFNRWPTLRWDFIGVGDPGKISARHMILRALVVSGRIRLLGPQPDLRAYYQHADIYAHPPGMSGGGMGVAMAVAEGLPVVVHTGSDPCNFVPSDLVSRDFPQFLELLDGLIRQPGLRSHWANVQAQHLNDNNATAGAGRSLWSLIEEATSLHKAAK